MARISIVLPTYNRADTILRAVRSVIAQTFTDWELHVVDDGSTDGTSALISGLDSRIRIHQKPNGGMTSARNRGLRESRGDYLAFLDSDDEWLPHHLELCMEFFRANPTEHIVSGEVWIDRGGSYEKHFRVSMADWYVGLAKQIHSNSLALPAGETDDYLRFYSSRQELPAWGRAILGRTPYGTAHLYRGELFQKWRWGYLLAAQPTVVSREAQQRVGLFDESYRNASCFGWFARLCRFYPSNMISAPSCIEHWSNERGGPLAEERLLTGENTALAFATELLRWHEELFWNDDRTDPELTAIRGLCQLYVGRVALQLGRRHEALHYLEEAARVLPGSAARRLKRLATVTLHPAVTRRAYAWTNRAQSLLARFRRRVQSLLAARSAPSP
jgi:glycosyltransferase involved in cell wall biosynthesis